MRTGTMTNRNAFKLGVFCTNCSGGLAVTRAPERWDPSWANNVRAAQLCDEAGFEFFLPVARWKGYGGEVDFEGTSWETLTWACGLLGATRTITVIGTVHVPLIHPAFAAKQMVTADAIGDGRFGLNIVCGWNPSEFAMFGVEPHERAVGYEFGEEWWSIVRRIWTSEEPFDFNGRFFQLKGVIGRPKPVNGIPIAMNAGISGPGQEFAAKNCDCLLTRLVDMDQGQEAVATLRALARSRKREIDVYGSAHVVLRSTQREADEYYHWYAEEMADTATLDIMSPLRGVDRDTMSPAVYAEKRRRMAGGCNSYPLVGDADAIANEMARISAAGFTGLAISFVNYLNELPDFVAEIIPRLERLGLRYPVESAVVA